MGPLGTERGLRRAGIEGGALSWVIPARTSGDNRLYQLSVVGFEREVVSGRAYNGSRIFRSGGCR